MNQAIQTPEQHVYLAKLLGYEYTIKYKVGKHNFVADALSRIHNPDMASAHWILSIPQFQFLDDLKKKLATLEEFNTLCQQISMSPDSYQDYKTVNSLILHKGRIWVPKSCSFIPLLLAEFHASPLGGHMGVAKTLSRLSANFIWLGMRKDVQRFISECSTCLQTKYIAQKTPSLLQPISPPSAPWEDLALDFITGLPSSSGFSVILVVVDRFIKGAHFGTLPAHFTASKVVQLFLNTVCKLHGFPKSLISDRDPIFISHFWQQLFRLNGTKLQMSTTYHPQSDDQTEVLNRILEQYLRAFVHNNPSQWTKFLSLAEWCYNTATHSAIGISPYQATYGKPPPTIVHYLSGSSSVEAVDSLLSSREDLIAYLNRQLTKAQWSMKHFADIHRRVVSYKVGEWVYVKLRPYWQLSVSDSQYQKLGKRYYGPFEIVEAIGPVAYRLDLPDSAKIHPVFHCSLLKPHRGPLPPPQELPPISRMIGCSFSHFPFWIPNGMILLYPLGI